MAVSILLPSFPQAILKSQVLKQTEQTALKAPMAALLVMEAAAVVVMVVEAHKRQDPAGRRGLWFQRFLLHDSGDGEVSGVFHTFLVLATADLAGCPTVFRLGEGFLCRHLPTSGGNATWFLPRRFLAEDDFGGNYFHFGHLDGSSVWLSGCGFESIKHLTFSKLFGQFTPLDK